MGDLRLLKPEPRTRRQRSRGRCAPGPPDDHHARVGKREGRDLPGTALRDPLVRVTHPLADVNKKRRRGIGGGSEKGGDDGRVILLVREHAYRIVGLKERGQVFQVVSQSLSLLRIGPPVETYEERIVPRLLDPGKGESAGSKGRA